MERLKQKVVSSSSRVIASLQQVARHPSFSESGHAAAGPNPSPLQQQHQQVSPQVPPTNQRPTLQPLAQPQDGSLYQQQAASSTSSQASASQQPPAAPCLTSDATAHLTEHEREILLEVFKKEEQFQRETIKQMRCQLASGSTSSCGSGQKTGKPSNTRPRHCHTASLERPSSSAAPQSSSRQPPQPEEVRAASACGQLHADNGKTRELEQQPQQKQCRICRKLILAQEPSHLCSACRQFVCDDCASYSSSHQHWTCSSCRRRATQPGIPADALRELGLNQNSSAVRRMTLRLNRAELRQAAIAKASGCAEHTGSEAGASTAGSTLASPQANPKLPRSPGPSQPTTQPQASWKADKQQPPQVRQGGAKRPASQHEPQHQRRRPQVASKTIQASDSSTQAARASSKAPLGGPQPRSTGLVCHQSSQTLPAGPTSANDLEQVLVGLHKGASESQNGAPLQQGAPVDTWTTRQPQTLVTASSDHSMNSLNDTNPFRRDSRHFSSSSAAAMLIPVPPDQIYMRRLSDQSNLMRRSSILAASAQDGLVIQRNRSHSEINAHPPNFFYHQAAADASHLFAGGRTDYLYQQQQQQYLRRMSDQQQYRQHQAMRGGQALIQSVVTPYSQKLRYSSEEIHSDSSSDGGLEGETLQHHYTSLSQQPIPSVSVSEFSSSQRYQSQLYREQMHQVNAAVEEAIMKQKRMMHHRNSLLLADGLGQAAKCRRGSSGRLLPKIPNEQSKSLLQLPAHMRDSSGAGQGTNAANHLDLPCLSPTIRRASAPEGQNIKIVVDDMDGLKQSNTALLTKQGQLYERLVLYRDHSLSEPNGNAARAFGLHVTGGKIVADFNLTNNGLNSADDKLQACVSWTLPGGPADKVGLRVGDCIVEWDGKWLVNMTYEQVAEVIESSGNIAELLVRPLRKLEAHQSNYVRSQRRLSQQTERDLRPAHQIDGPLPARQSQLFSNATRGSSSSLQQVPRRLPQIPPANLELVDNYSSLGHLEQTHLLLNGRTNDPMHCLTARHEQQSRSANELHTTTTTVATSSRNGNPYSVASSPSNMPKTSSDNHYSWLSSNALNADKRHFQHQPPPHRAALGASSVAPQRNLDDSYGLIGLQVSVDESMAQLEFSILSAVGVPANPCLEYHVRVRILPESHRFKPCFTHPSSDMNWKETFIFQDFPTQQIQGMSLEIGIWVHEDAARLAVIPAQPICETLIPIKSACEHNTDFWPLRASSSSPSVRRKSLNDLVETPTNDTTSQWASVSPKHQFRPSQARESRGTSSRRSQQTRRDELQTVRSREHSGSNINMAPSTRFPSQPRRASDEAMASSNSYRLAARLSPAQGRRAISVTNVGGEGVISRPSSRLGSQGNVMMRKFGEGGLANASVHNSPGSTNLSSPTSQMSAIGTTPTGRRSSLAGIQSMSGYRSQKNSQSGSTDHEQPYGKSSTGHKRAQHQTCSSSDTPKLRQNDETKAHLPPMSMRDRRVDSPADSRRESSEQSTPPLERKRSFAMLTLRKLKRTMSLTKAGNDSNAESRRSSSSSAQSTELEEDTGVSRRLMAHQDHVGRLKLALVMTKGQLELEVICAEGLRINWDNVLGIYVKVYLVGGGRSNKRKTRVVQPSETPVFKQLIKYDGSLVDNKSLEVSMWQRQGNLKGKSPIGFTIIRLADLKLDQLQTVWYSLHPKDVAMCGSSFEDS